MTATQKSTFQVSKHPPIGFSSLTVEIRGGENCLQNSLFIMILENLHHLKTMLEMSISLFIIMDPIGVLPLYTSLTNGLEETDKRKIAYKTSITVVIVLLISAIGGKAILKAFGVDIPSFRVAGGILLAILALQMLHATTSPIKRKSEEHEEASNKIQRDEPIWIIPLAIPMLTGPATMSTMILLYSQASSILEKIWLLFTSVILGIIVYLMLNSASYISSKLGKGGINLITRLMGLILLAIAVKMVVKGIKSMWYN